MALKEIKILLIILSQASNTDSPLSLENNLFGPIVHHQTPVFLCKSSFEGIRSSYIKQPDCSDVLSQLYMDNTYHVAYDVEICMVNKTSCECDWWLWKPVKAKCKSELIPFNDWTACSTACNYHIKRRLQMMKAPLQICGLKSQSMEIPYCTWNVVGFKKADGFISGPLGRTKCHFTDGFCKVEDEVSFRWYVDNTWFIIN